MKPRVLAFCGVSGAGKSTVAACIQHILIQKYHYTCQVRPFSSGVKAVSSALAEESSDCYVDLKLKKQLITNSKLSRSKLMELVAQLGLLIRSNYWFENWEMAMIKSPTFLISDYIIVPDYSHKASLPYIKRYRGLLIYVKNREVEGKLSTIESEKLAKLIKDADITVLNNITISPVTLAYHVIEKHRLSQI